jgi:hypothetical protein
MQRVTYADVEFAIKDDLWTLVKRVFDVVDITGGSFTVELPLHLGDGTRSTRATIRFVPNAPWIARPDELIPEDEDPVGITNAENSIDSFLQRSLRENKDVQNELARNGYFGH